MKSSLISTVLGYEAVHPREFEVKLARPPNDVWSNCITLVNHPGEDLVSLFKNAPPDVVVIAPLELRPEAEPLRQMFFFTDRPRLAFCRAARHLCQEPLLSGVDSTAVLGSYVVLGKGVSIGRWCALEGVVEVGSDTQIGEHTVIHGPVVIGDRVRIKPGCVLGTRGFGFERDEKGIPIDFPHFGKVIIGNDVEIGANSTIARGSLNDTMIKDHTKIDDQVHVGHNVQIGECCLVASGVVLCGSARLGRNVWIGPNVTISNGLQIGDDAFVGLGSVVIDSVPQGATVATRPAIPLGRRNL